MSSRTAGYLGPVASFSHQATLAVFPESKGPSSSSAVQLKPLPSFSEIFSSLQSRAIDYGVIPFENSSNGSVLATLDLLADRAAQYTDIQLVGEYYLPVHHCLLVPRRRRRGESDEDSEQLRKKRISRIQKLYTHPQAWGQCEGFLSKNFRGIERQDVSSTSKAAEVVARESQSKEETPGNEQDDDAYHSAAIASHLAAEISGLEILAPNIEDSSTNVTRFFVFTRTDIPSSELSDLRERVRAARKLNISNGDNSSPSKTKRRCKSLITFTITTRYFSTPGSLASALEVFKRHGFNLTSIDTRPSRQGNWRYVFFVECESIDEDEQQAQQETEEHDDDADQKIDQEQKKIQSMVKDLVSLVDGYRVWGCWEDQV